MQKMKEMTLDDMRKVELEIMDYIDTFCRERDIGYSITAGTLIGAVRHSGYIPWDDDIDLMMTRENYQRFLNEFDGKSKYDLITYENEKDYYYAFAKVVDTSTLLVPENDRPVERLGVFVDIFPLDYCGDTYEESVTLLKKTYVAKYFSVVANWKKYYLKKNASWFRQVIRFIFYIMSKIFDAKKILRKVEKENIERKPTKYMVSLYGNYKEREIQESTLYHTYIDMLFEGHKYLAIKDWEKYLTSCFNDFMSLPPEDQRVSGHLYTPYRKE